MILVPIEPWSLVTEKVLLAPSDICTLPHDGVDSLGEGPVLVVLGDVAGLTGDVELAALGL